MAAPSLSQMVGCENDHCPQIPKKLELLSKEIVAALRKEAKYQGIDDTDEEDWVLISEGLLQTKTKSIRELADLKDECDEHDGDDKGFFPSSASSSIKLEVIYAWKDLLDALVEHSVFLDYVQSLEDAFREIIEKPTPSPSRSIPFNGSSHDKNDEEQNMSHPKEQAFRDNLVIWFQHQLNLAKLLTHTAKNHYRDQCTECRFVTLLEIALSYQSPVTSNEGDAKVVYQWKASNDVQRFWVRLQQPIDPDMTGHNFRRKAYGVLVSLSWVPASPGLLSACSIPDKMPALSEDTPSEARRILNKIPRRPLPRHDSVYQVLDRLKDETNVSVVISASKYNDKVSSLGIGKTTVAALVASHPLILRSFKVLWLTMDRKRKSSSAQSGTSNNNQFKLDYAQYIQYLESLCDQLGCTQIKGGTNAKINKESLTEGTPLYRHTRPVWPEVLSLKRLEEPAIRQRREENHMRRAKRMMADLLEISGGNVLLILDDVSQDDELEWFHFFEKQSTLATSHSAIHNSDFVVELDPWGEAESIELFLLEADCSNSHAIASSTELKEIVKRSHYHPIIVRTAARWFKLKKVTAGLVDALEESEDEFSPTTMSRMASSNTIQESNSDQDAVEIPATINKLTTPRALVCILNQMLSPTVKKLQQPSILFKLSLASMVAVFSEYQPVPLTAVLLLWEQLFSMDPDAIEECGGNLTNVELRKRVWFIAEGLAHMGILSFSEDEAGDALVAVHHDLYRRYALDLLADMDLNNIPGETIVQWHKAFVAAYLTRKFESNNPDSCHEYALQKLPTHMLYCKLYVKVVALLSNGRLFQERVAAFGRSRATDLHVRDCVQLMQSVQRDTKIPRDQREEVASEHFQKVAKLLTENFDTSKEKSAVSLGKDLYLIGFSLAENQKYKEALDLYAQAQNLVPKSNIFAATILYGLGSVNLILNDHGKAIKSLMASIACMQILGEDGEGDKPRNTLYQEVSRLYGEALIAQCSYKMALTQFEETLEQMNDDSFESEIEYGILMYRKGRLHQVMGDNEMAETELKKCIKWKEQISETSRSLVLAHSALVDVYSDLAKPVDARKHIDLALRTIQEVNEKWPKLKYEDDEDEYDIQVKLISAKWRSLRPDLSEDLANYDCIRKKIVEFPELLMDQSGYDLRFIARAFMAADKHEKAVFVLEDALKIMSERTDSLERALCLIDLGNSFMDQGERYDNKKKAKTLFELALKLFGLALGIQRPKIGDCHQVLETLDAIGNLHVHLKQHETAVAIYSEALILARKLRSDAEKIAGILFFLGECAEEVGQLDTAELRYKECVDGLKLERPSDDLDLARPLQRLGAISLVKGKYDDAKEYYDEMLKIRISNFEAHDELLAETLDVLGFVEMKPSRRNYESARSYLMKALAIRMQHDNFRAKVDCMYQIGLTFRMQFDFVNAMKYLERSLSVLEQNIDENNDPLLGKVHLAIGNTHFNQGKSKEAAKYCQKAMELRTSVLGPDHRKTANAARSLGMTFFLLQKHSEAQFLLQEYCRIYEGQSDNRNNLEYMAVLIMLGDIQVASGRHKLAKKILSTAKDISSQDDSKDDLQARQLKELRQMIDLRQSLPTSPTLNHVDDREQGEVTVQHNPKEVATFQSLILTDD